MYALGNRHQSLVFLKKQHVVRGAFALATGVGARGRGSVGARIGDEGAPAQLLRPCRPLRERAIYVGRDRTGLLSGRGV